MDFNELRGIVSTSDSTEWHKIDRQGPTYRDRFGSWTGPGDTSGMSTDSHSTVAAYKPDLDLTIAYGMDESPRDLAESLNFEWSKNFADQKIRTISLIDFFWRGSLVDRLNYVYVDGARGIVPLGHGHQGLRITQYDLSVARLLSDLEEHREFMRYYNAIPFELQD